VANRFVIDTVFKVKDGSKTAIRSMKRGMNSFTSSATRGVRTLDRRVQGLTKHYRKFGIAGAAGTAAIGAGLVSIIRAGTEFEQQITNAAARFPGEVRKGTKAFADLEAVAMKTGQTTEFTATQTAEALGFMALAGFDAEQAIAALPGVVDLATASNIDLAKATEISTNALGAFGLRSDDSAQQALNLARVNDVLTATATSATLDMETLFETMKDGAVNVTSAGQSMETFAALTGVMADSSIKGTRAGTAIKNMFLRLQAIKKGAATGLVSRFIGDVTDEKGDLIDIVGLFGRLEKNTAKLGKAQRASVLEGIFGKIAITGVSAILETGTDKLRAYRDALTDSTGKTKEMADVMRGTTHASILKLGSAFEGLKISIFGKGGGPFKELVDWSTEWVVKHTPAIVEGFEDMIRVAQAFPDALVETMGEIDQGFIQPLQRAFDSFSLKNFNSTISAGISRIFLDSPADFTPEEMDQKRASARAARRAGQTPASPEFMAKWAAMGKRFAAEDAAARLQSPQAAQGKDTNGKLIIEDRTNGGVTQEGAMPSGVKMQDTGGF